MPMISSISRREFFRLSAGSLGALSAVDARAGAGPDVSFVIDPQDRQASAPAVAWAVQELESALLERGLTLQWFESIEQAPRRSHCILAATPTVPAAMQVLSRSAVPAPTAAESLAIVPASFASRKGLLACGADARGLAEEVPVFSGRADRRSYSWRKGARGGCATPIASVRPSRPDFPQCRRGTTGFFCA
jgi:hypothetical protein